MSSVLNGAPSDHFMPLRSVTVRDLPSGANTWLFTTFGISVLRSAATVKSPSVPFRL